MSRKIVIGDVHGCFYTLKALLSTLSYTPNDQLFFLGDLIGKGHHSDQVLEFAMQANAKVLLGNHEIAWMRSYLTKDQSKQDFKQLSQHSNAQDWFEYLVKKPFVIEESDILLVHASLYPTWNTQEAIELSHWLSDKLISNPQVFFQTLSAPKTLIWNDELTDSEKAFLLLQIFTRCRYFNPDGSLDLKTTASPEESPRLIPWYEKQRAISQPIAFGHWASLGGRALPKDIHLDGGAVYGGKLLAQDLDTQQRWSQQKVADDE